MSPSPSAAAASAPTRAVGGRPPTARQRSPAKPPLEHSLLYTATLCLLAGGAVMVYSASSVESLLAGSGDASHYLKRYLLYAALGLAVLHFLSRRGVGAVRALTPTLLVLGFVLTAVVMVPGVGVRVNGATRWLAAGPVQFQPSELLKVALVLFAARVLAAKPARARTLRGLFRPLVPVVAAACVLLLAQPDMGTAIVICLSIAALLVAAGTPARLLGLGGGAVFALGLVVILVEPYRRARLTAFLDPWSDAGDTGFQVVQSMIAIGSGGLFGVGLGESVQKIFYLPEAHTDMILAIIGEEVGLIGIVGVIALYGMIAYAGLRAAKLARDRYTQLLAAGITSLILCQATLNLFAVMGLAPLTGVPLPFLSFGNSNLIVLMAGMGVLLNVAATGGRAHARGAPASRKAAPASRKAAPASRKAAPASRKARSSAGADGAARSNSGGGNRRPRSSGAGDSRRAAG